MKYETKISTISIVCALCATVSMPAFSAPVVRSLGGAGTYNGTSSAASGDVAAVRGGALRVNNTASSANKKSTGVKSGSRAAATPRLSIGKYLGGSTTVKNNTLGNGGMDNSLSGGGNGNLQERIRVLEAFMGYAENGDTIPEQMEELRVDVEQLAEDLKKLSSGEVVDVTYADGVLTVVKAEGEPIEYPLSDLTEGLATKSAVGALEAALDDLQKRMPAIGESLVTEQRLEDLKTVLEQAIDAKQDSGDYASAAELKALAQEVEKLQPGSAGGVDVVALQEQVNNIVADYASKKDLSDLEADMLAKIAALDLTVYAKAADVAAEFERVDAELAKKANTADLAAVAISGSYDDLTNKPVIPSVEGFLTADDLSDLEDAVDALVLADASMDAAIKALQGGMITEEELNAKAAELAAVDKGLQDAIEALQDDMPSTEGLVNKDYVDGLVADLQLADTALQNAIEVLEKPDVNKAYVDEAIASLNTAISGLRGADSAMEQTIAGLEAALANAATKEDIKDFITGSAVDAKIQSAVSGLATAEDIKDFVTSGDMQAEIAKLATKTDIAGFVNSSQVTEAIADATKDLATKAELVDFVKSGDLASTIASEITKADLATKTELANAKSELQAAIDKLNAGDVELTNYYTKAEVDSMIENVNTELAKKANTADLANVAISGSYDDLTNKPVIPSVEGFLTADDLSDLEDAVDALVLADASMDAAIKALQGGMITEEELNAKAAELAAVDKGLQDAIEALQDDMPSTEGLVNKDYVDGLVADLQLADTALQNAIEVLEKPDVNKAYVDEAIASLNTAISGLRGADSAMEQTIAGLEAALANAATKEDIKDFITGSAVDAKIQSAVSGLATAEDIKDFVTSGDMQAEIAKLATKTDIAGFVNSSQVTEAIADATKDLATKAELVDFVKSGDLASTIASEITKADLATKTELANAKSELQAAIDKLNAGDVELTNYYTKAEVDAKVEGLQGAIDAKQDKLTAGTNITISNNVISASVDTSGFVPNPGTTPTEYGEYVLMLSIGEDGKPESYDWLNTLDLMGDTGFEM